MCFISIIVPTFNSAATITSCLKSIFNQTFTDYEILIQDGGSTDSTLDILSSIQDPRLKVVSEKDSGVYDAMNKATFRSKGDWLCFLGSDDSFYKENVLEAVVERLNKTTAAVVYGDVKLIGEGGVIKGDENNIYRGITPVEELFIHNICHQAMFYRSIEIKKFNIPYELKYVTQADHSLNIKMAAKYPFEYLPIVIANFKNGGLSSQIKDNKFKDDFGEIILNHYGMKLTDKKFYHVKSVIKKTANKELKKGNIISACKGYFVYLRLKF